VDFLTKFNQIQSHQYLAIWEHHQVQREIIVINL
jgi:hypothetical protein